jgi:hypothetical protein
MKEKEVVKVDGNGSSMYSLSTRLSFSLLSSLKDGRKQILGLDTCRDWINDCLISFFNIMAGNSGSHYWKITDPPVDTTRLRLLIAKSLLDNETAEGLHNKMRAVKRIINMYEEIAGFKKKSVLRRVEHSDLKVKHCWVLIGPSEWLKSSHLVSMITLITRIIVVNNGFENLRNIKEVEKKFEDLSRNRDRYTDNTYLSIAWPKFRMLMTYYNEIFRSRPTDFWYPPSKVNDWHSYGGIVSLCNFETDVPHIDELIKNSWEMWNNDRS